MFYHAGKKGKLIPSWFWVFFIGIPIFILIRWFFWWFFIPRHKLKSSLEIEAPRSEFVPVEIKKDDFSVLKGIGPKISTSLHQAGILTFEQLGLMQPEKLAQILLENSIPRGNAGFWQKQAKLAAAEDWKKLETLQKKS